MSDSSQDNNRAVWFDIPAQDLDRACTFYASVLKITVDKSDFEGFRIGVLEHKDGNGACIFVKPEEISASAGLLVYMNVEGRIRDAVVRTVKSGGKVIEDMHAIGAHGFRAIVLDSEGNRIALHSSVDA